MTVSQCQASMRDVNPTSKQGPEEEPLDNRTLNPHHQAYTAQYHTHTHTQAHADGGQPTGHAYNTDTEQVTDRGTVAVVG